MTEKQKRFADEYLIDLNGTRAYKVAYPNVKSDEAAAAASARMLRNVKVKAYIDERLEAAKSAKTAEATEVLEYLTSVMRGSEENTQNRIKAAELLGKRYGLFTDKLDLNAPVTIVIKDDYGD